MEEETRLASELRETVERLEKELGEKKPGDSAQHK
jgi:hypothetical protein